MEKNFVPNRQWMAEKYDEMNSRLFGRKLGNCLFEIFTTGRGSGGSVLGWFKITGANIKIERRGRRMFHDDYYDREYINKDNFVSLCQPKIELNGNYRGTEHGFLCTLVHEMCHYYTYMYGWAPVQAHGREFREIGSIVSSRSNGEFTIQRIASAEQMSELELNDEMKAKKEKRLMNKKASVYSVIVFKENGKIELSMTSNNEVINQIKKYYSHSDSTSVIVNNDSNVIDFLFSKGYRKNMRTWRYWDIGDKPWIDELKSLLIGETIENEIPPVEKMGENKIFIIKTTNGTFECNANSKSELIGAIKNRFPKMSDETIEKIINNPSNYRINNMKRGIKDIINEVIDEYIENEGINRNKFEDSIEINPDMNLGIISPLQVIESVLSEANRKNVTRIRITHLAEMGRNKEIIMDKLLMLRHARNVGDEESVNNTVLSALRRYPSYIQFEVIG